MQRCPRYSESRSSIAISRLHGYFYAPAASARAAVLLLSPLFEEQRCAHRTLTVCARALAQAGAAVLRPDLYGTGNSDGLLSEITLDRWFDDVRAAAELLRARVGDLPLTLLACRAGALLAANAVAEGLPVERLVLWQPVVAGRNYLTQLRTRRMIQDQLTGDAPPETGECEVEGHALSAGLYSGLQTIRLPAEMPSIDLRLLQCSFNETILGEYARLSTTWGERLRVRCLNGEPFWNPHSPANDQALAQVVVEETLP